MTDPTPSRKLLTREQVIEALRKEVESAGQGGMTATAKRYGLSVQQVSDVLNGRARLTERMWTRLQYVAYTFFAKLEGE